MDRGFLVVVSSSGSCLYRIWVSPELPRKIGWTARTMSNVYKNRALNALPRVLALLMNPVSDTRGVGDRYFWSWKGRDFANGTFQGAVHGIACLTAKSLLPSGISELVNARADQRYNKRH